MSDQDYVLEIMMFTRNLYTVGSIKNQEGKKNDMTLCKSQEASPLAIELSGIWLVPGLSGAEKVAGCVHLALAGDGKPGESLQQNTQPGKASCSQDVPGEQDTVVAL